MKYKVGQKVKVIGGEGFGMWKSNGSLGETGIITYASTSSDVYFLDKNKWGTNFRHEWLELIETPLPKESEGGSEVKIEMQIKLKEGDKVMLETGHGHCFLGEATIAECENADCSNAHGVHAVKKDGLRCHCHVEAFILISSASKTMANLTTLTKEQKAGLSPENQAFLELGLIDNTLVRTPDGERFLIEHLWEENQAVLAKKAAKRVAEIKAEAKASAKKA